MNEAQRYAKDGTEPPTAQTPLLTHEQFQRELSYRAAMAILRELRRNGLITSKEFVTIAPNLAQSFSPVWGDLYQNIA